MQFQNVRDHSVDQFMDATAQVVVAPEELASGELIYPSPGPGMAGN